MYLWGGRHPFRRLRRRLDPGIDVLECLSHQRGRGLGQFVKELTSCGRLANRHCHGAIHRSGVEVLDELEDAGTRLLVPSHDGPLHRGSSPPTGQQGEVQIDPTMFRRSQEISGDETAISDNDCGINVEGRDGVVSLAGLHAGCLDDANAKILGGLGDGAGTGCAVTPYCGVRPGQDGNDLMMWVVNKGRQGGDGYVRGASEK